MLQCIWHFTLITQPCNVPERDSGKPVSVPHISHVYSLEVILFSCKIPHEITPIHPVELVGKKETDVISHCRFRIIFSCLWVFSDSCKICIIICMPLVVAVVPHSWEKMKIGRVINRYNFFAFFLIFVCTFYINVFIFLIGWFVLKILSFQNRPISVLFSAQV